MLLSVKVNIPLQICIPQSLSKYYFFTQWESGFPINTLFPINRIALYMSCFLSFIMRYIDLTWNRIEGPRKDPHICCNKFLKSIKLDFLCGLVVKILPANAGDMGSILALGQFHMLQGN